MARGVYERRSADRKERYRFSHQWFPDARNDSQIRRRGHYIGNRYDSAVHDLQARDFHHNLTLNLANRQ